LLLEHCERLWLLPPAEVLAELGVEVPALYEPQGRDHAEAGREVFAGIVGHGIG